VAIFSSVIQLNSFAQNEEAVGNEDMSMIGLGTVCGSIPSQLVVTEYDTRPIMKRGQLFDQ